MNFIKSVNLGELCEVSFGQHLKSKSLGDVKYLQVKNFTEEGIFLDNVENYIEKDKIKPQTILCDGDILFVGKGMKFFAYKYEDKMGEAVASSVFFILKIINNNVNPEYLTCILNQPKSLAYFYGASAGSSIPSIRKKELLDFQIKLPPLNEQEIIVNYYKNYLEQQKIISEIKSKNQILFQQVINQLTKESI